MLTIKVRDATEDMHPVIDGAIIRAKTSALFLLIMFFIAILCQNNCCGFLFLLSMLLWKQEGWNHSFWTVGNTVECRMFVRSENNHFSNFQICDI